MNAAKAAVSSPPQTALQAILEWSETRPMWQRDALRRILIKGRLDDDDHAELVELCKKGRGAKEIAVVAEPLARSHLPPSAGNGDGVSLISIADVAGVNNLAPGQTLAFEPRGITVIYGDNGAGKSGYARILKRACRARFPGTIRPNVYASAVPSRASATLTFAIGSVAQAPATWVDTGEPHDVLSDVLVFDTECAAVHLDENEVVFRPFGLDIPDGLAGACKAVQQALKTEQQGYESARHQIFARPSWRAETTVGKTLARLRPDTKLEALKALGTLSADEEERLHRLREDLAKNPATAAAEQTLKATGLRQLRDAIIAIATSTTDLALTKIFDAQRDARTKKEAARVAAESAFAGEALAAVGGDVWQAMWDAARRYSTEVAYPDAAFPNIEGEARCVLCQQGLNDEAGKRLARFEEFIRLDTEKQARVAADQFRDLYRTLAAVRISSLALKSGIDAVAIQNPVLARNLRRSLASARLQRLVLVKALKESTDLHLPAAVPAAVDELDRLHQMALAYAAELKKSERSDERKKLDSEVAELSDRALLAQMQDTVADEVRRLGAIQFLKACLEDTTTNTITSLGNAIADSVITPRLRDRFQEEIVRLAADKVRVEIVRSGGRYGSPQYQVQLFAKPGARIKEILSEGERTCVALAAFLTEVATTNRSSAFVFDDPVSSLDHRWRQKVAERLVEESRIRQVIAFTHDLIFVNNLADLARRDGRDLRLLTVSRGSLGSGVVSEGLPWKAQRIEQRIDGLEKAARAAKELYDQDDEDGYNRAVIQVYGELRASWERALEEVAFHHVIQRHRDYIETRNLRKVTVVTEEVCSIYLNNFQKCSGIVDAHDPSLGRNATPPAPAELLTDIKNLRDWVDGLRAEQKKIA